MPPTSKTSTAIGSRFDILAAAHCPEGWFSRARLRSLRILISTSPHYHEPSCVRTEDFASLVIGAYSNLALAMRCGMRDMGCGTLGSVWYA